MSETRAALPGGIKLLELLTILVSVSSVISSGLYTYVYVVGQQTAFFQEIHTEYASPAMMEAMDLLEGFHAATGANYGPEYVRLKGLSRQAYQTLKASNETSIFRLFSPSSSVMSSDAELGKRLDSARRKLVHYWAKVQMFHELGYLTDKLLLAFPGRARAEHSLELIEPLIEQTAAQLVTKSVSAVHEHLRVLARIREIYSLAKPVGIKEL
eukprot:TRINITY_DN18885_c0_g2_i4.p1 TRINITY_DN18885_c0_g2~~TRINITY_DN18885_c0_g2_i4.p1  ORF type:complete len:212 (+),score=61.45 TRINITY_DN18885_c0_g2_i4:150-785(+)